MVDLDISLHKHLHIKKTKQLFAKYIDKKFKSKNSPASNRELSHPFRIRIKDYCVFFVFCGGHFESLINMRSASAKSENRSLELAGKFANSRLRVIFVISVPDLAVADRASIKNKFRIWPPKHNTRATSRAIKEG